MNRFITYRLLSTAVLGTALPVCILAQNTEQHELSLHSAIQSALSNRQELKAAARGEESAVQLRRQAGIFPNPRLFYQSENLAPGIDFSQGVDTYAYASQVLEISGRRGARISLADSGIRHAQLALEQERRSIEIRVAQAYWDALRLQYLRTLAQQNVGYYREILDYHQKRFNEGKIAAVDLLRVRLEEARAEANADGSQLAETQAKQKLAREMGMNVADNWKLTESFDALNTPQEPAANSIPNTERVEVRLAQQAVDAARANLMAQKAQGRPDIDTLLGYKRTTGLNTMIAGFQVNLPVFDRNQGAVAAAQSEMEARQSLLRAAQQQSANDLALARESYETWRRQVVEHYQPLVDQAVDIANISRAAYREGGSDLLRLLDAERLRVDTQTSWAEALGSYHQSVLSLEYAEGLEP